MKTPARVSVVLVALAVLTSVASAEAVRVNYDYAATGIDAGQGLWSITIDSGLIPNPDLDPNDPNSAPYLDPNTVVTFSHAHHTRSTSWRSSRPSKARSP